MIFWVLLGIFIGIEAGLVVLAVLACIYAPPQYRDAAKRKERL